MKKRKWLAIKEAMIVKQILPRSTSENVYTTVWRISILMIECKYNPLVTAKIMGDIYS